jgi:hypothetical protein
MPHVVVKNERFKLRRNPSPYYDILWSSIVCTVYHRALGLRWSISQNGQGMHIIIGLPWNLRGKVSFSITSTTPYYGAYVVFYRLKSLSFSQLAGNSLALQFTGYVNKLVCFVQWCSIIFLSAMSNWSDNCQANWQLTDALLHGNMFYRQTVQLLDNYLDNTSKSFHFVLHPLHGSHAIIMSVMFVTSYTSVWYVNASHYNTRLQTL